MNELDITRRAKEYMDALAQGVDPIRGRPVPPGDTLSQERLRRCFQYVSGVLAKVIAEQSAPARDYAAALRGILSPADLTASVSYSQEPVSLVSFWADLSKEHLVPLGLRNVSTNWLLDWLEAKGIFTRQGPDAEPVVSDQGQALGLIVQLAQAEGKQRSWWRYSVAEPMQRMIVENLEEFVLWDQVQWDRFLSCAFPVPASAFSREPVKIMELSRRLSAPAAGSSVKKVSGEMILRWLTQKGYMQPVDRAPGDKGATRVPTSQGNALGITLSGGQMASVYYEEKCQRFIADHLPEIVDEIRFFSVL